LLDASVVHTMDRLVHVRIGDACVRGCRQGRGRLSDAPVTIGALFSLPRCQSMDHELFGHRGQVSVQELVKKARLLVGKHLLATHLPHSQSSRYKDCGVKPVIFRAI
jgi:hypothetical protein